uniref:Uncharacterized protein n=1 Tax=Chromera velia CCMP2878 TaxID=1169474 RepID=A0A0G4FEN2_9ALVE|eukprot:Cvel_16616.t1-p1 / transcript=Cvel_16616.t1 / gene=Cvel_16616 / organism=Chromera_velia_CCMP2878 / gene_product=Ankyrin repeat domain-containing protein 50, putative / transcript_product=Ankyrin repeat domain-containing protein 50, putative / location=Cvel_scaffold1288:1247-2347(+) / protein_length=367 / sequence_SO=supercontig / SO=protein_coding / is_pseudo=false
MATRRRVTVPFDLPPIILRNVRRFKPVSPSCLRNAVRAFMEGRDDAGRDLLLLCRVGCEVNALTKVPEEEKPPQLPGTLIPVENFSEAAIHFAVRIDSVETVERLLLFGAFLEREDSVGLTPLILGSAMGQTAVVQALLRWGANANRADVRCSMQRTPLMYAAERGHAPVAKALVDAGAEAEEVIYGHTVLAFAAAGVHPSVVSVLLASGADVNSADEDGETPLMKAAQREAPPQSGHPEVVSLLLAAGAPVDAGNRVGKTGLMFASIVGNDAVVRVLLKAGADVNRTDRGGVTALRWAVHRGHAKVVKTFLEAGADVNTTDRSDGTVLRLASTMGQTELVRVLLGAGADPDITTAESSRETALIAA